MTPQQRYDKALDKGDLIADPGQARFVAVLNQLHAVLCDGHQGHTLGWLERLARQLGIAQGPQPVTGIYVWGGVGRGKTLLVDSFYDTLTFENKLRIHFHDFMQQVHASLKQLGRRKDPLAQVAADLAGRARVLCFDEFHVADIADAMILGRLFRSLFEKGVVLVATSNNAPEELYVNGLQRQRFVPAIHLIRKHTQVIHLNSERDYRLRTLQRESVYLHPLTAENQIRMGLCFDELSADSTLDDRNIVIAGRRITIRGLAHGSVWFDFKNLCETSRSAADYLELARLYHTVMVSDVPQMDALMNDAALRFIHLVDNLYDHNVNLVVSAACEPALLYCGERHGKAFRRTRSRLEEMQSQEYLSRPHVI